MSNFFKTSISKLKDLPWTDCRNLFSWPGTDKYKIQAENPNLLIAKASDEIGEAVAYLTAESILLVDSYTFNPKSSPEQSGKAGDAIDRALGAVTGAKRIWIVVPNNCPTIKDEQILRVVERKVFVNNTAPKFDDCELQQSSQFLN